MRPKVTLLSWTGNPIETVYAIWQASKSNAPLLDPVDMADRRATGYPGSEITTQEARELFGKLLDMDVPVIENLSFSFMLEDVSVSLREQLVRHRIGVHVGDAIGVDIVPDLADSSWWSQSMRILDMKNFAREGRYHIPETIEANHEAYVEFIGTMDVIADAYRDLVERYDIPMEDARELIPLGATSRISWTLNAAALKHIIGKRCCWILQLSVWGDVIRGMLDELATKVDPLFRRLAAPPCWANGCFTECKFRHDNERRIQGLDEIPPCAVWMKHEKPWAQAAIGDNFAQAAEGTVKQTPWDWERKAEADPGHYTCSDDVVYERWLRMCVEYQALWGDDVTM